MSKRKSSRRDLFSSIVEALKTVATKEEGEEELRFLFPPGATDMSSCQGCGECAQACPYDAIKMVDYQGKQTPAIIARISPCRLCPDLPCVDACPTGALRKPISSKRIRLGIATIDPRICRAFGDSGCRLCYLACPLKGKAIIMMGTRPLISSAACTGCGICEYVCPTSPKAVRIIPERELVPGVRVPKTAG